jgi:hypothetical protein
VNNIEKIRDRWEHTGILDGFYGDKNNLSVGLENQKNYNLNIDSVRFRRISIPLVFGIFFNNSNLLADEECRDFFVSSVNFNHFSEDIKEDMRLISKIVPKLSKELEVYEHFHLLRLNKEGFIEACVS